MGPISGVGFGDRNGTFCIVGNVKIIVWVVSKIDYKHIVGYCVGIVGIFQ